MILHLAHNTPGAGVDGKHIIKPKGWDFTIEGIHKLVKNYISMHGMVDVTAQGGATAANFTKNIDDLWKRKPRPAGAGADKTVLRVALVSWLGNDVAGPSKKNSVTRGVAVTDAMREAASRLRNALERYPVGIIIGPGMPKQWNCDELWGQGAEELLERMKPRHFHVWRSDNLWSSLEMDGTLRRTLSMSR